MNRLALSIEAVAAFCVALVFHKAVPFKTVARIMGWSAGPLRQSRPGQDQQIADIARAVYSIRDYTKIRECCLAEAMTIKWMLSRRNIEADIYFGMRIKGSALAHPRSEVFDHVQAHAWVQIGDTPLKDNGPFRYVVLGCYH